MNVLKIGRVLPGVALLCLFSSCGGHISKEDAAYMAADTVSYAYNPDTSKIPKERLMVRQAEMNFKVKELQKTSQKISAISAHCGGEVWNSHLQTEIQNTISKKISADSLLEVITYRQTNEMTIRVPSRNLDSLLVKLEDLSQLLHTKKVTTENVSLDYLSNELKSKNMARTQDRYENKMGAKKSDLEQYTAAEYFNTDMQNAVIDHQINNLGLMDKVNFSTVKISIYQDTEVNKNIVANLHSDRFDPGFGASAVMAVQDGWEFMLSAIIFLIRIWPLYLFSISVFFLIKHIEKTQSRKAKPIELKD
jgi:hypothetical protein